MWVHYLKECLIIRTWYSIDIIWFLCTFVSQNVRNEHQTSPSEPHASNKYAVEDECKYNLLNTTNAVIPMQETTGNPEKNFYLNICDMILHSHVVLLD